MSSSEDMGVTAEPCLVKFKSGLLSSAYLASSECTIGSIMFLEYAIAEVNAMCVVFHNSRALDDIRA